MGPKAFIKFRDRWLVAGVNLDRPFQQKDEAYIQTVLKHQKGGMNPDFAARQIVDDACRAGVDIQFTQHIVEYLNDRVFKEYNLDYPEPAVGMKRTWGR